MKVENKPAETDKTEKLAIAVIDEARMVLPGIQALFGFQMISAFNDPSKRDFRGSVSG